ncbi:MAG: xanthine dehydrogenase family protein molybdopterin-binding subunit, partial [Thermoplasmata archaeon]
MNGIVGSRVARPDAFDKVVGVTKYTGDIKYPGMLYGALLHPPFASALIKKIDVSKAKKMKGVHAVLTAKDIPGENNAGTAQPDQPALVEKRVRHMGDGIALVAAESPELARAALNAIEVEYEQIPGVYDPIEALKPDAPLVHEDGKYGNKGNVLVHRHYEKGKVDLAWKDCDVIVENTYRTPYQEHAFLEPECALARLGDNGEMIVEASLQCPFYARQATARVLGWPLSKVRIVQAPVGGAFGGKEDVPSEICARAALLALKTGRPVLKVRNRRESLTTHTKRHPFIIKHKIGAKKDGRIVAVDVEAVADQGAYASVGPYVLYRATVHAHGVYDIPNIRVDTKLVYTNNILTGAFRGFGQPQVAFAVESQIDALANKLGLDPMEVRRKNLAQKGSISHMGHVLKETDANALKTTFEYAFEKSNWAKRRKEIEEFNKKSEKIKRGLGAATIMYGVSLGREAPDTATSIVQIAEDASVSVAHGGTEMGQGSMTVMSIIAAEELGIPLKHVHVLPTDTALVQNSGPSVASRVTPVIGESVRLAAKNARIALYELVASEFNSKPSDLYPLIENGEGYIVSKENNKKKSFVECVRIAYRKGGCLTGIGHKKVHFEEGSKQQYFAFSPATHIAEVEVDLETGKVKVLKITAVNDVGRAINPLGLEGQIQGGVLQGLGLATMEEVISKEGKILNPDFRDYLIPTSKDMPNIEVHILECPEPEGPFGAKGIGE